MKIHDVLVIGGGLAGASAAHHLAKQGLDVLLLEKERGVHQKVCGEFVSAEGLPMLEEMGIDLMALGGQRISAFRLHGPQRTGETYLPDQAVGFSRRRLDEIMLDHAAHAGAEVRRGVMVKRKTSGLEAGHFTFETSEGDVFGRRVVLATGKHDFKSVQTRKGRDSGFVGFKMHVRLRPTQYARLRDHCDLFIFKHGYGGLSPIEGGLANFCFLIERTALKKTGTDWDSLASYISMKNREASHYLDGAEPVDKQFATVANIPYGFLRRGRSEPGLFCVGDQMAVIPSLTGDGMSIALTTGRLAAHAIASPATRGELRAPELATEYHRFMRRRLRSQVDAGFILHQVFKKPGLCDWATYAINVFPPIVDYFFARTRCVSPSGGPARLA